MLIQRIDTELMDRLSAAAKENDRRRSHHTLHQDASDPFQRMVVGMEADSYIRPHRHLRDPKPETLVCLRGRIGVVLFDDDGKVVHSDQLFPQGPVVGCDIAIGVWHMIVSLNTDSVFLEAKPGPYVPFAPEDFADWAPEPNSPAANPFLQRIVGDLF